MVAHLSIPPGPYQKGRGQPLYIFRDIQTHIRIASKRYCDFRVFASPCLNWSVGLASVSRMPARPHRTVDRVIEILETVSLSPRGVTLPELAAALDAAKSSVQELTNGLLARGYLIEEDRRFHLGPGPFILAVRANKLAALSLDHRFVAELANVLRCTVLVGIRVGDAIVFTDLVGEESPGLTFVARTHARRPLYTSAAGKTLLANVPDDEMHRLLDLASPQQAGEVRQFLAELPEIRSRRDR